MVHTYTHTQRERDTLFPEKKKKDETKCAWGQSAMGICQISLHM